MTGRAARIGALAGLLPSLLLSGAAPASVAEGTAAPTTAAIAAMGDHAAAVDPDRRAAARTLLEASGFRARQEALLDDSLEAARAELVEECINEAAAGRPAKCSRTLPAPMSQGQREHMIDAIMEAAVTVYAQTFSAAQMEQIVGFFDSDIGRSYSKAYPPMLSRIQTIKRRLLINELKSAGFGAASGAKP